VTLFLVERKIKMSQIEMVSLEELVKPNHVYRKYLKLWDFKETKQQLKPLEKENNYKGYGLLRLFKCLLLQFMEDLSDRELESYLQENMAAKLFCDFGLTEVTPHHTVFGKLRKKLGTKELSKLFSRLRDQLQSQGYMNEVFSFVDASHLIAKANLWQERDQAIKEKYEKLNNEVLPKVAHDKQAKIGCKGKNKYWYGYKKHACVDMQSGLINKVAITAGNVTDAHGLKHVCPNQGAIYADKGYCVEPAKRAAAKRRCHLAAIKKNNMKDKNKDKDRWYSRIRAPYERVFSQQNKRVRYCGVAKNQFAAFMEAICFNLKRLSVLAPPTGVLS
jgi:IS5 family transposase